MQILVTNEQDKAFEGYVIKDFNEFLAEATSEEGWDTDNVLYIDINAIDDENTFESIDGAIPNINWIAFDESNVPEWYVGTLTPLPESLDESSLSDHEASELANALSMADADMTAGLTDDGQHIGRIVTFGSAKGGSGKTFTSVISAVYYAKDHPDEKVCILDLDIEEPQIAIVIRQLNKSIKKFYANYLNGEYDFEFLEKCKCNVNNLPPNLDFYLTPRDEHPIQDSDFWQTVMTNLFLNYDMTILDTGTTYMETPAISSAYKIADKVNIVTMCNLASTVTVAQQMKRLTGEIKNDVYSEEDEIEKKVNLIITNSYDDKYGLCDSIIAKLEEEAPVIARFGVLIEKINEIQVLGHWDLFDDNAGFRQGMRDIMA